MLDSLSGGWTEYKSGYVSPLLYVLRRGFVSGKSQFFNIYTTERRRFFPHALRKNGGQAELEGIVIADAETMTADIRDAAGAATARRFETIMHAANAPLLANKHATTIKLAMVGDCVMTEIRDFLEPMLFDEGIGLEAQSFYFSARNQVAFDGVTIESSLEADNFDLISLSFLTFEGLPFYTALLKEGASGKSSKVTLDEKCDALLVLVDRYITSIREKTNAPILLHGCSGLPLERLRWMIPAIAPMGSTKEYITRRLNDGLAAIAEGFEKVILIDERKRVSERGLRAANRRLLPRIVTRGALFHPSAFGMLIADEYAHVARAFGTLSKTKVLLVDFDNTLWSGVMAEGPVVHNVEGQTLLKELKDMGILLVSLSKNDPKNIRWEEMALEESDFVLHKISWDNKPQSVLEVASQLDLDPKSFVLIDDNPVERDLVTSMVRGVTAFDPTQPETWRYLRLMTKFPATQQTEEAKRRTAMYREAANRREAQNSNLDYASMMRSLELRVGWRRAKPGDLDRLHELINRTNQFNTTTIRYSGAELGKLTRSPDYDVYVATLADKFGKLGIVGSVICHVEGTTLTFESVVMSCRAMGFGLETVLVAKPLMERPDMQAAIGRFVPTDRNNPCADLFRNCGFEVLNDGTWHLDVFANRPACPAWFAFE